MLFWRVQFDPNFISVGKAKQGTKYYKYQCHICFTHPGFNHSYQNSKNYKSNINSMNDDILSVNGQKWTRISCRSSVATLQASLDTLL